MSESPTRLRDLLASAGRKLGMEAPEESARLFTMWREIVGPDVAERARPKALRSGVLKVWVESPAWATEITYLGPEIVARAAEVVGPGIVTEIRPYLGTPPPKPHDPRTAGPIAAANEREKGDSETDSEDDPAGALARARLAWEKRARRGVAQGRSQLPSDRQIPR